MANLTRGIVVVGFFFFNMCGETDLANIPRDSCRNRLEMLRS